MADDPDPTSEALRRLPERLAYHLTGVGQRLHITLDLPMRRRKCCPHCGLPQ